MKRVGPYDHSTNQPTFGDTAFAGWANANPGTGENGSTPPMEAVTHPIDEIVHVIEQAGLTPSEENLTQLYLAIQALIAAAASPDVGLVAFALANPDTARWLHLNGALINRAAYPALTSYAVDNSLIISEAQWAADSWGLFGEGDGSTTLRLPDPRGEFFRIQDGGRDVDYQRQLGERQTGSLVGVDSTGTLGGGLGLFGPTVTASGADTMGDVRERAGGDYGLPLTDYDSSVRQAFASTGLAHVAIDAASQFMVARPRNVSINSYIRFA